VIHYQTEVASDTPSVRFVSRLAAGEPRYRLSYRQTGADTLAGQFEVAPPDQPNSYRMYLTWTAKRKH
jgi:hypothetical protein